MSSISFRPSSRAACKARVLKFHEVAPSHYQMRLNSPSLSKVAQPGQFVHVLSAPNSDSFGFDPLLRRAFSIMNVGKDEESEKKTTIEILFRVEGRGTKLLAQAQVGDEIDLIGPLGRPFDLSPFGIYFDSNQSLFHVKQSALQNRAILVGGGVGVPPLAYLGDILSENGVVVEAIIGARTEREIIGWNELSGCCGHLDVTTDDGSRGHRGRVTDVLSESLGRAVEDRCADAVVVYACGPLPMLRAVAQLCAQLGVKCQVSMEENMPCGIGVCNGCVVRVHPPGETIHAQKSLENEFGEHWSAYNSYRRVCVEGPACWADEIDWEHNNG